jgi:large subunit ribosomal protein L24e
VTQAKCVFCGKEQEDFRGTYLIKNDGSMLFFSSSKCMKNHLKLKRDKRKVRWAEAFHLQRAKRLEKLKKLAEKDAESSKELAKKGKKVESSGKKEEKMKQKKSK